MEANITCFKKVLIIEDSKTISYMLCTLLKKWGFSVCAAYNGEDGLLMAHIEHPDFIILDLVLPNLPGEEVCRTLRKEEQQNACSSHTPIIMVTGKTSDVDHVIGRVIGADAYIKKPFNEQHLHQILLQIEKKCRDTKLN